MTDVFVADLESAAKQNENFRKVLFTGSHSQLVDMALRPGEEIGLETHEKADQILYAVAGKGVAILAGKRFEFDQGSVVCVPAGTEHNIISDEHDPLRLFTVYAPPQHAPGTLQASKPAIAGRSV
jgi:mannose-6-phosphate isomerase-like protein (cupin superfamily)